jgi:hypothetical protein
MVVAVTLSINLRFGIDCAVDRLGTTVRGACHRRRRPSGDALHSCYERDCMARATRFSNTLINGHPVHNSKAQGDFVGDVVHE